MPWWFPEWFKAGSHIRAGPQVDARQHVDAVPKTGSRFEVGTARLSLGGSGSGPRCSEGRGVTARDSPRARMGDRVQPCRSAEHTTDYSKSAQIMALSTGSLVLRALLSLVRVRGCALQADPKRSVPPPEKAQAPPSLQRHPHRASVGPLGRRFSRVSGEKFRSPNFRESKNLTGSRRGGRWHTCLTHLARRTPCLSVGRRPTV